MSLSKGREQVTEASVNLECANHDTYPISHRKLLCQKAVPGKEDREKREGDRNEYD